MRRIRPALFLALGACAPMYTQEQLEQRQQGLQTALDELKRYQLDLEAENQALRTRLRGLEIQLDETKASGAREASARIEAALAELDQYMRRIAEGSNGELTWFQGPEGPVVRIQDQILFRSGSHQVSEEGRRLLAGIGPELAATGKMLRVEGHTDNEPVRLHAEDYPRGNLDLSAERAVEVAAILIEHGVAAQNVSVVGHGEWRPIASNGTPEGRRRNRRVEIVVLSGGGAGAQAGGAPVAK